MGYRSKVFPAKPLLLAIQCPAEILKFAYPLMCPILCHFLTVVFSVQPYLCRPPHSLHTMGSPKDLLPFHSPYYPPPSFPPTPYPPKSVPTSPFCPLDRAAHIPPPQLISHHTLLENIYNISLQSSAVDSFLRI